MLTFRKKLILIPILSLSSFLSLNSYGKDNFNPKVLVETNNWQANINLDCLDNNKECGKVDFKGLNCSANLKLIKENEDWYIFYEEITDGKCEKGCLLYINKDFKSYKEFCENKISGSGTLVENKISSNINIEKPTDNVNNWILDQNGCKSYNPNTEIGESVNWNGKCENGYEEGKGTLQWYLNGKENDKYIGSIKNGKYNGKGTLILQNGDKYVGEFKNGKLNGKGSLSYSNGAKYEGDFKNYIRSGKGKYIWKNGDKYEGRFKNGKLNGKGTLISINGKKYTGYWNNGVAESNNENLTYEYLELNTSSPNYMKTGYIDAFGNFTIPPIYYAIGRFKEGLACAIECGGKKNGQNIPSPGGFGWIDRNGKWFIRPDPNIIQAGDFSEGFAKVQLINRINEPFGDGRNVYKWGFIDIKSKLIEINAYFDYAGDFSEGLAPVEKGNKWGFINKNGSFVIKPYFESADSFKDGITRVEINKKWGFIDKTGKLVIPANFDSLGDFLDGLAVAKIGDKYGFIDGNGIWIIQPKFDFAYNFANDFAPVQINKKWGFIDENGKLAIPAKFETAYWFEEGLARVKINEKWGFIDRTGKMVVEAKFEEANSFKDGLASVEINKKWGFIDKTGKLVIPAKFDSAYIFENGFSFVQLGKSPNIKYGLIDKKGDFLTNDPRKFKNEYVNILALAEKKDFKQAIDLSKKVLSSSPYKKELNIKVKNWIAIKNKQKDEEERKKYQIGSRVFWYAHILNVADEDMGLGINFEGKIIERIGKNKLKVKVVNGKVSGGNTWAYQIKALSVLEDFIGRVIIIAPNGVNNIQTNMRGGG